MVYRDVSTALLTNAATKSALVGAQERVLIVIVMPACITEPVSTGSVYPDAQVECMW